MPFLLPKQQCQSTEGIQLQFTITEQITTDNYKLIKFIDYWTKTMLK